MLARRARREHIEKFRNREADQIATPIRNALEAWAATHEVVSSLHAARPVMPEQLHDRAADICEPLLAIADLACGRWPDIARAALAELCTDGAADDENIAVKLLAAVQEIFEVREDDRISTKDLLAALIARDNGDPWSTWWEAEIAKGNTRGPAAKLARLLKPFGVVAGTIREEDNSTSKGYKLASFEDAFSRYLPPQSRHKDVTTSQPA